MEKNYDIIIFWNQQKILHIHLKNAKYSAPLKILRKNFISVYIRKSYIVKEKEKKKRFIYVQKFNIFKLFLIVMKNFVL